MSPENFTADFIKIETEVSKVIIGQKETVRNVLCAMVAGGNVLLEGLPGLGKTRLVRAVGTALGMSFSRVQFTPDLMPADITGTDIFIKHSDGSAGFEFSKGPVFANIVLADEINRATPKTQSALLEAMQEGTVTAGKTTYALPKPFFVLATQNPLELEGTYPLPEAQLDRFLIKLSVQFPARAELLDIVTATTGNTSPEAGRVCGAQTLLAMGALAREVPMSKPVGEYAIDLVYRTHAEAGAPEITQKYLRYGASPRGAQALVSLARIYALLDGRYNVAYEDIKNAALPCLRHRLFLNFEAAAEGVTADDIIRELVK